MYTLWPIQTKKDRGRRIFLQEYDQGILDPCQSVEIKFHGGRRNSYFRVGYSPARPTIFLEKKRGEGGREGRGGGSVCKSCQTLQRRTEQRQRVHPISRLGRKNFHYSLIPSSPPPHLPPPSPSYRCSFHPLVPDTLRRCTSPHLGRQIRQEESQNLISRDAPSPKAFSSYPSPPSLHLASPASIKTAGRGRRGPCWQPLRLWDHAWPRMADSSRENPVSEMRRGSFLISSWMGGDEWRKRKRGDDAM